MCWEGRTVRRALVLACLAAHAALFVPGAAADGNCL